jgi:multiple sugar transport system permease protein
MSGWKTGCYPSKEYALTATVSAPSSESVYKKKRIRWLDVKEQLTGYLFITPSFLIIAIFGFFPIGYALYMSTFRWRVIKTAFIGLDNYHKAIGDWMGLLSFVVGFGLLFLAYIVWTSAVESQTNRGFILKSLAALFLIFGALAIPYGWNRMLEAGDPRFLESLPITLFYAIGTVPAEIALALVLAYILFQKIRGKEFFRMLYFLPYITPVVAAAVVFRTIFSPRDSSLANIVLSWFGIPAQKWLFEPRPIVEVITGIEDLPTLIAGPSLALVSVILFGIWTYVGYNTVIFLAGLGSIPSELYEAAEIDGANKWDLFRHITLPLLSPITFYLALIAFIGTFKAFNHIYVMRVPSAQGTINTASVTIFDTFYKANQYGYAAAQAILLFVIILALTMVQNKVFGERVFYG